MPQCNARCTQSHKCMQGCRDRFNATQPQAHLNHEPTPFASICLCFLAFGIYCFLKARCHPNGKKHSQQPGQPQLHIIEIIFVALRLDALLSFLSLVAFISSISGFHHYTHVVSCPRNFRTKTAKAPATAAATAIATTETTTT